MAQELFRLALLQSTLVWEAPEANRQALASQLASLPQADLILLPEMFSTGFSMKVDTLAEREQESLAWLQASAREMSSAIAGSVMTVEEGAYFNRLYFVYPDGSYQHYDKAHLFSLAGEDRYYQAGKEKLVLEHLGWRINPQICYDLRFPAWCRNLEDFDLQFFVANWPDRRAEAWRALLQARAIENMAYVAGVNRIGEDGHGIAHSGFSRVIDPLGQLVKAWEPGQSESAVVELSYSYLQEQRDRFGFLRDRDSFHFN